MASMFAKLRARQAAILDNSPEAVENRIMLEELARTRKLREAAILDNSPDEIETRAMLATLRERREAAAKEKTAQAAANFEHAANLAHQIATAPLFLLPEIDAPPITP